MPQSELKEKTSKGFLWSGVGSGCRQIISTVIGLILLRCLSPDDYGLVGMLAIFIGIAGTLQEGGFISALINRKEDDPGDYDSVFWINVVISAAIYTVLFLVAPAISRFFGQPLLIPVSRVLFISIFTSSLGIAHSAYLKKHLMQKEIAIIDITASIVSGITAIILAIKGFAYWALVANTVVYSVVTMAMRWAVCPWRPSFRFLREPVKEMFSFSSKLIVSNLITQTYQNFYSLIIGKFCNQRELGYYTQGNKWSKMISGIFTAMDYNIGQPVIRQSMSSQDREVAVFRKLLRCIVFVNTPCIIGFAFISKDFITLLNPEFLPGIPVTYIVSCLNVILPVTTLMRVLFIAHGKSEWELGTAAVAAAMQIVAVSVTARFGILYVAIGASASELLTFFVAFVLTKRLAGVKLSDFAKDILPSTAAALLAIAVTWFITKGIESHLVLMLAKMALTVPLYLGLMYVLKADALEEGITFIRERAGKQSAQINPN